MEIFRKISAQELSGHPIGMIAKDWMLITATKPDGASNCMTASWGGLGELWNTHVAFCFVRPERYTCPLIEKEERISLAFFDE